MMVGKHTPLKELYAEFQVYVAFRKKYRLDRCPKIRSIANLPSYLMLGVFCRAICFPFLFFSRQIPFFKMAISGVFSVFSRKYRLFHNFSRHFPFFQFLLVNFLFSVLNKVFLLYFPENFSFFEYESRTEYLVKHLYIATNFWSDKIVQCDK